MRRGVVLVLLILLSFTVAIAAPPPPPPVPSFGGDDTASEPVDDSIITAQQEAAAQEAQQAAEQEALQAQYEQNPILAIDALIDEGSDVTIAQLEDIKSYVQTYMTTKDNDASLYESQIASLQDSANQKTSSTPMWAYIIAGVALLELVGLLLLFSKQQKSTGQSSQIQQQSTYASSSQQAAEQSSQTNPQQQAQASNAVPSALSSYVMRCKQQQYSKEQVRTALRNGGYQDQVIDQVLGMYYGA